MGDNNNNSLSTRNKTSNGYICLVVSIIAKMNINYIYIYSYIDYVTLILIFGS